MKQRETLVLVEALSKEGHKLTRRVDHPAFA